jgi:hypothetical protein
VRGHLRAVAGVVHAPVAGQQVGEAADLAPAHGVRLAGERQRPAARAAEVARREAEVDQRAVLQRPDRRLVGAHRPQRHRGSRAREQLRRAHDVGCRHAADARGTLRRPLRRDGQRVREPARVPLDERRVEQPLVRDHAEHGVEQRQVGARPHRQVQIGGDRGGRCARIGQDHGGTLGLAVADPAPHDRVAGRGVAPQQQQAVGQREIGVRRRRPVEAECARVAGDRARHAQARVRVDVVRAEEALGQLADRVVVLGQQLPGDVERHRVGAVLGGDRGQPSGHLAQRLVPAHRDEAALASQQRARRPIARVHRRAQLGRLAARAPVVDGMAGVAAHRGDAPAAHVDLEAAAGPAVRAEGQVRHGHGADHREAGFPDRDGSVSSA